MDARDFVRRALETVGIEAAEVTGRTKRSEVVRAREILVTLAVERYGLRLKDVAISLGVRYDTASLWGRSGAMRRAEDTEFSRRIDELDTTLSSSAPSASTPTRVDHE